MNAVSSSKNHTSTIAPPFAESVAEKQEAEFLNAEWSSSLLELLCAAAISEKFCQTLLFNPDAALDGGFNGQQFSVTVQERLLIRSISATSLPEFVRQLEQEATIK